MKQLMTFISFDRDQSTHLSFAAQTWTESCGEDLAITPHFIEYNTRLSPGFDRTGMIATCEGNYAGFVLVSYPINKSEQQTGFIDAFAVSPKFTSQGIGSKLLHWAEHWLSQQNCNEIIVCQGPRPFAAGLPLSAQSLGYFRKHGYRANNHHSYTWDLARDLFDYNPPYPLKSFEAELRPVQLEEEVELLQLMEKDFYGGWLFDFQQFRRDGGKLSEYLLLWTPQGAVGFCQVTFEDSVRPIERFYPHGLPHPWGQMGTFGIAEAQRGKGYGAVLIDSAARYLKNQGIRGCIIDWTGYLELYGKFGFIPYRQYAIISKPLIK
jgi:GNAT superfamily N-acetyltransferase